MDTRKLGQPPWHGPAAGVVATLLLVDLTVAGDVLYAGFGRYALLFWGAILLWFVLAVLALRRRQIWWVLFTAPIIFLPLFMAGSLALACMRDNCL